MPFPRQCDHIVGYATLSIVLLNPLKLDSLVALMGIARNRLPSVTIVGTLARRRLLAAATSWSPVVETDPIGSPGKALPACVALNSSRHYDQAATLAPKPICSNWSRWCVTPVSLTRVSVREVPDCYRGGDTAPHLLPMVSRLIASVQRCPS